MGIPFFSGCCENENRNGKLVAFDVGVSTVSGAASYGLFKLAINIGVVSVASSCAVGWGTFFGAIAAAMGVRAAKDCLCPDAYGNNSGEQTRLVGIPVQPPKIEPRMPS